MTAKSLLSRLSGHIDNCPTCAHCIDDLCTIGLDFAVDAASAIDSEDPSWDYEEKGSLE